MISTLRITGVLILLFSAQLFFAQSSQSRKNLKTLEKNEWRKDLTEFSNHSDFFESEKSKLGLAKAENMKFRQVVETKGGWRHTKYQQFYEGIPVLGSVYILHENAGKIQKANGKILPNISINTTPSLNVETALRLSKNHLLETIASENEGRLPEGLSFESIQNSEPKLYVADKKYPRNSGEYTLAYVYELEVNSFPPRHDEYVFDAHSGEVIEVIPQVCHLSVEGTIKTKYYGVKTVTIDSISENEYRLQDFSRGDGIITESDITKDVYSSESKDFDLTNEQQDEAAGDAHWGMIKYYDWLLDAFNWESIDNEGHELRSKIHIREGDSYVNAFWNGRFASFGIGNCAGYGPLTAIDVVSHEFTHGLTRMTSGLVYRYESGGLNESMSDMFGKALEYYEDPDNFTWEIGRAFVKGTDTNPFRNMQDPNVRNHPKFYKGRFWAFEGEGVHTNSNVMNHWFYSLVEGASGTAENGYQYDVPSIGMDKVMDIVFAVNTAYLTPTSDYLDAYNASMEIASDLFGAGSSELAAVDEAWKAVGIDVPVDFTLDLDLAIELLTDETRFCGKETEVEIIAEVQNLSKIALVEDSQFELGFRLNSGAGEEYSSRKTEMFTLGQDLPSGEKMTFTFTEKLELTGTTGNRERIEVFIGDATGDEFAVNNIDFNEIFITEFSGEDLEIDIQRLGSGVCHPNQIEFELRFRNRGCTFIPEGAEVEVDLSFYGSNNTIMYSVPFDLETGDRFTEVFSVNLDSISENEMPFSAEIRYDSDENSDNNRSSGSVKVLSQTGNNYYEDFSDFEVGKDDRLYIDQGTKNLIRIVDNSGDLMLGVTGTSTSASEVIEDCMIFDKVLEEHPNFVSLLEFCADLGGINDPVLSFDLAQFSRENSFNIPQDFTSVFTVSLSDPDFETIFIYDQPMGEITTYNIPLPADYSGQITLGAFNMFGSLLSFVQGRYEEGNVHLIDDIRISDGTVNTQELSDNQSVTVFPNPADKTVWFENVSDDFTPYDIDIFNSVGVKVKRIEAVSGKISWNTDANPTGVYFYKISRSGRGIDSGKLILEK